MQPTNSMSTDNPTRRNAARPWNQLLALPLALVLAAPACTGSVGGGHGTSGAGAGNSGTVTGNGGAPSMPGGNLPETGLIKSSPGPSSAFLRLTSLQWENTVRDLFRLQDITGLAHDFLSEPGITRFDNAGGNLDVSPQLRGQYQRAADTLSTMFARDASKLAMLIPSGAPSDADGKARAFITAFGKRAFRRPLTSAEVDKYVGLFKQGATVIASSDPIADGVELVLTTMLQSANFVYRMEIGAGPAVNGKIALTDYEMASRLSYSLGNTMPDDQLLALADSGQLHTNDQVYAQAKRLLDSAGGHATVRDLYHQTFRAVDPTNVIRDPMLNPAFVTGMGATMKHEQDLFVDEAIFNKNGNLKELLTGPYTFVNKDTAPLYGVPAPSGTDWAKVDLDPKQRGGLYTQLGFLTATATDKATRPIIRGVHMNRAVLCANVPPPPPGVNTNPPPSTGPMTTRQYFEMITAPALCQGCHGVLINPLGFAFENYDNLGRYRTKEGDLPIDAKATYTFKDGSKTFSNAIDLMNVIAQDEDAHRCYAEGLFSYFYGRDSAADSDADKALVDAISRRSSQGAPVKSMILDLAATDSFLYRLP